MKYGPILLAVWTAFFHLSSAASVAPSGGGNVQHRDKRQLAGSAPQCVTFEGPAGHVASGEYVRDDTLTDCSKGRKPRYKHREKQQYLYSFHDTVFGTERWQQAAAVLCLPIAAFFCVSTLADPLASPASCWKEGVLGLPAAGVSLTGCSFEDCVKFTSASSPQASGEYVRDDSLTDCSAGERPRYKHRTANQYIFWFRDILLNINRWQQGGAIGCFLPLSTYSCVSDEVSPTRLDSSCWKEGLFATNTDIQISDCSAVCATNPCVNGNCVSSSPGSYTCSCDLGWAGVNCSELQRCTPNPCENGGTCVESSNGYTCQCGLFNSGPTCKDSIFDFLRIFNFFLQLFGITNDETARKVALTDALLKKVSTLIKN